MYCKCGHQLRDHEWNFIAEKPESCTRCNCMNYDYSAELSE